MKNVKIISQKFVVILLAFLIFFSPLTFAADESINTSDPTSFKFEHLDIKTPAPIDLVKVSPLAKVICRNNLIPMAFSDNFSTKSYKDMNVVEFYIPCDIGTKECTTLIPKDSVVLAQVECIKQPKVLNQNAKAYIVCKKLVFPDGRQFDIEARPYENSGVLQKSSLATFGRASGLTIGGFGLGAGNGAWIGAAASHAWTGTWLGMAIGGGLGLICALASSGMHYKAKRGDVIFMKLDKDIVILDCN